MITFGLAACLTSIFASTLYLPENTSLLFSSTDTLNPVSELIKIRQYYEKDAGASQPIQTSLSYKYYEYVSDTLSSYDSADVTFATSGQKYRMTIGNTLSIQDERYNVTIYHDDNTIYIREPVNFQNQLIHLNLLDSILNSKQIQNTSVEDSASYRFIRLQFTDESPFITVVIQTDAADHRLHYIDYTVRKPITETEASGRNYIRILLHVKNHQVVSADAELFSTAACIQRQSNGRLAAVGAYEKYELINTADQ